jgi:hypothetical protein
LPLGSLVLVIPCATICESHKMGAPARKAARPAATAPGEKTRSAAISIMPQAWMILTATLCSSDANRAKSASLLMSANDRR